MFTDKTQFASAFTALVTPEDELVVIESPRVTRELELPGGGVDTTDLTVRAAADREVLEEAGLDTADGCLTFGQAELRSRLSQNKTGLFVVALTQEELERVDFTFTGPETRRLLTIPIGEFIGLPTKEEEPDAPILTFRAHRVMATIAMGILSGELPSEVEEALSAPFETEFVQCFQGSYYEVSADL